MDRVSFVLANKADVREAATVKNALPGAVEAGISQHASDLYDEFVRSADAEQDPVKRASLAVVSLELCALKTQMNPPSVEEVKELMADLHKWNMPDMESMARIDVPVADLKRERMSLANIGSIREIGTKLKVQDEGGKTKGDPRKTVNIDQRLKQLNLHDIPSVLKPDGPLVKAILLQMESGVRLPLDFSPKKAPLFPTRAADAFNITFSPIPAKVDEAVYEEAKKQVGQAADTAHKNILLEVSSKMDKEMMPSTTHILMRIRHAIALLVCEAVPQKEQLRLIVMVASQIPLVASHTSANNCYMAAVKYEEYAMKRATDLSRDVSVEETMHTLVRVESDTVKAFKEKVELQREHAKITKQTVAATKPTLVTKNRNVTHPDSQRYEPYGKTSGKGGLNKPGHKGRYQQRN